MRSSTRRYLVDSLSSAAGVLSLPGHGWFLAVAAEFRVRIVKHIARLFGRQSALCTQHRMAQHCNGVFFYIINLLQFTYIILLHQNNLAGSLLSTSVEKRNNRRSINLGDRVFGGIFVFLLIHGAKNWSWLQWG